MVKLTPRLNFLLAFVELFKEPLTSIDLMKLLFLYCKKQNIGYYSFFPYLYGCFSYEVYKDKRSLIEKGFLQNDDNRFITINSFGAFYSLSQEEKISLDIFHRQMSEMRGDALIRKTYLEYPEYMKLSVIKERILTTEEIKKLSGPDELPFDKNDAIYTIGYEGISIDEYLRRLIKADIDILIDVRKNPKSMKFDFNHKKLADYLSKVSIQYMGLPELGIPSDLRIDLTSEIAYQKLFAYYDSNILPFQLDKVCQIASLIQAGHKVALACYEKDIHHCHRYRIAKKLFHDYGFEIINL